MEGQDSGGRWNTKPVKFSPLKQSYLKSGVNVQEKDLETSDLLANNG